MLYMITWQERPQGSARDYEQAQKRILEVFGQWQIPDSMNVREFVVRVGEWGGMMLVETDDVAAIHRATSTFAAFRFSVDAVLPVEAAVQAEMEAIAWRDSLPGA